MDPQYSGLLAQLLQRMQGAQQPGMMPGVDQRPINDPGRVTQPFVPGQQMMRPEQPMSDPGQNHLDPETGRLPGVPGPMGSGGQLPGGASQSPAGVNQNWQAPGLKARGYLGRTVF